MGPSVPGPIVLLVDCPTESHAKELLSVKSLESYYSCSGDQTDGVKLVNCIIHLSPSSVTSSPTYQSWMKKFHSSQHILAGHQRLLAPLLLVVSHQKLLVNLLDANMSFDVFIQEEYGVSDSESKFKNRG